MKQLQIPFEDPDLKELELKHNIDHYKQHFFCSDDEDQNKRCAVQCINCKIDIPTLIQKKIIKNDKR